MYTVTKKMVRPEFTPCPAMTSLASSQTEDLEGPSYKLQLSKILQPIVDCMHNLARKYSDRVTEAGSNKFRDPMSNHWAAHRQEVHAKTKPRLKKLDHTVLGEEFLFFSFTYVRTVVGIEPASIQ